MTLQSAASKGLAVPASAGTSAAETLTALAPGQVMHALGRKLMKQENDENRGEVVVTIREEDKKVDEAERQVEVAITQLGYELVTTQPRKT